MIGRCVAVLLLSMPAACADPAPCPMPREDPRMMPPGSPPDFYPHITPGATPESPVKVEMRPIGEGVRPADLSASVLKDWKVESTSSTPPIGVQRVFSRADGAWVELKESTQLSTLPNAASSNAKAGPHPAMLLSEGNGGRCLSTFVQWKTATRAYSLQVSGSVGIAAQRALAEEVAASVGQVAP